MDACQVAWTERASASTPASTVGTIPATTTWTASSKPATSRNEGRLDAFLRLISMNQSCMG